MNVSDEELVQATSLYQEFLNEEDLASNEHAKTLNDLILSKIAIAMERQREFTNTSTSELIGHASDPHTNRDQLRERTDVE